MNIKPSLIALYAALIVGMLLIISTQAYPATKDVPLPPEKPKLKLMDPTEYEIPGVTKCGKRYALMDGVAQQFNGHIVKSFIKPDVVEHVLSIFEAVTTMPRPAIMHLDKPMEIHLVVIGQKAQMVLFNKHCFHIIIQTDKMTVEAVMTAFERTNI